MVSKRISSLKRKSDFRELLANGRKARVAGWLTIDYIVVRPVQTETTGRRNDQKTGLTLGLSISRKIGSAVVRNKLKRWSREYFRKAVRSSQCGVKLNLRLKENGDFYKHLRHSEYETVLDQAWTQIKKSF